MGLYQPAVQGAVGQAYAHLDRIAGDQIEAGGLEVNKGWAGSGSHSAWFLLMCRHQSLPARYCRREPIVAFHCYNVSTDVTPTL